MLNYLVRRLLLGAFTLLLITFIIYALIRNMPGTPLTMDLSVQRLDQKISDADLRRLERIYGLDKPWYIAYFQWMNNLTYGDFGRSFLEKRPVTEVIGKRVLPLGGASHRY